MGRGRWRKWRDEMGMGQGMGQGMGMGMGMGEGRGRWRKWRNEMGMPPTVVTGMGPPVVTNTGMVPTVVTGVAPPVMTNTGMVPTVVTGMAPAMGTTMMGGKKRIKKRPTRRMRGGFAYALSQAQDYSAPGMLLSPAGEARALAGMNPEWKLATDPSAFAPKMV